MKIALRTAWVIVAAAPCLVGCIGSESKVNVPRKPASSNTTAPAGDKSSAAESPASEARVPMTDTATPPANDPQPGEKNPPEQQTTEKNANMVETQSFGKTAEGEEVTLFTTRNKNGLVLKMIDYGAIVVALETPDKNGKTENITLGFNDLQGYLQRHPYFGSTVGRYGNRIAQGKFKIGDQEYTLATNNGPNHLHGGNKGFDAVMWKGEPVTTDTASGIKFTRRSPDGEEGYPGNLDVQVTYLLTNDNELRIDYQASTDKPTVLNLTNHNYWNLGGQQSGPVLEHELVLNAEQYVPVDETSIPTGELAEVEGTLFDFRTPHSIGERIEEVKKLPATIGYDHCYVLKGDGGALKLAAKVTEPRSGRTLEIHTTEPGIQFYSGNYLDGSEAGGGFKQHEGFCLETQHFPDSPNQPSFPSTLLEPGNTFKSTTVHKFGVAK
jgi:aldose 1-epimerase